MNARQRRAAWIRRPVNDMNEQIVLAQSGEPDRANDWEVLAARARSSRIVERTGYSLMARSKGPGG